MNGEYNARTTGITVVDGVEVNVEVSGDEDRAEKVLMDLKERLGRLGAAIDAQTPPDELPDDLGNDHPGKVPPMTVAWDRIFEDDGE